MIIKSNISKCGNAKAIRIPNSVLEALNWSENDKIELRIEDGEIKAKKIIEIKKRKNIKELFADHEEEYECEIIEWGNPVGKEIW